MFHLAEGVYTLGIIYRCILATRISVYQRIETYHAALATIVYNLYLLAVARLEADSRSGGNVQMAAEGRHTVEFEVAVYLEEVEVRAHLNGAVARVAYGDLLRATVAVVLYILVAEYYRAYGYALLWCEARLAGVERLRLCLLRTTGSVHSGLICVVVHIVWLFNRMVNTYQARAVGEYRLDLQECNHIGHALHNIALAKYGCRLCHNLLDTLTLAGAFECGRCDVGNGLGIVELQALFHTPLGNHTECEQREFVNLSWS